MSMADFAADYVFVHKDDIMGHCDACKNHGGVTSCSECKDGDRFELDASCVARTIVDTAVAFAKAHCGLCVSCEYIRYCKNNTPREFTKQSVTCYACGKSGKFFTPASNITIAVCSAVVNGIPTQPAAHRSSGPKFGPPNKR